MLGTLNKLRSGFTLMEVVLVLAIMVAAAAMAIPIYHGTLKRERVRKAAEAIGADWTRTRAAAIETGETQLWVCTLADGSFSRSRYLDGGGLTNGEVADMASQDTGLSVTSPSSGSGSDFGQSLPQGVSIGDVLVSEGDTIVNLSLAASGAESGSATLLFYPDGTSSSARITVKGEDEVTMAVVINGMAGTVRMMWAGIESVNRNRSTHRSGITLLEIVLSIALTAIALALLAQLVSVGNSAAAVARDSARAQLVAQSIMAEVMAGIIPAQSVAGTYEADPMWSYEVAVGAGPSDTINVIRVTAMHNVASANPMTYSLTQWQAIPPEVEEEETEDTSGGGV